jgi:hypothetical protein
LIGRVTPGERDGKRRGYSSAWHEAKILSKLDDITCDKISGETQLPGEPAEVSGDSQGGVQVVHRICTENE